MKILGIDPGYGRCGIAVVEKENGRETLLHSACIETSAKKEFPERLAKGIKECSLLIKKHRPDVMALEKLFFTKNQKTAMRVAEVRGAIISEATKHSLPVHEYTPNEIKSAVASSGNASKQQVAAMLKLLLKIEKEVKYDDEWDAIAVAMTHLAVDRATTPRTKNLT